MRERFIELDGLRGLAALAVVVYHMANAYDTFYPGAEPSPVSVWWGMFGVQLFFMISGFVILMSAQRAERPSDFAISRVSRLYPAYWIALILSIVVSLVFRVPHEPLSWTDRLLNFTMVQRWFLVPNVDDVYWTLAIEMQFYVMVFGLLLLTRARLTPRVVRMVTTLWIAIALGVALWASPAAHGVSPQLVPTPVKLVLNAVLAEWAPLFGTGVFAYLARTRQAHRALAVGSGVLAVLIAGLLNDWVYASVVAAMVVCFLVVAFRPATRWLRWRPVQWYGRISYSLYIGHSIHGVVVMHLLMPWVGRVWSMFIAFGAVSLIAWAIHEVGENRLSRLAKAHLLSLRARARTRTHPREEVTQ